MLQIADWRKEAACRPQATHLKIVESHLATVPQVKRRVERVVVITVSLLFVLLAGCAGEATEPTVAFLGPTPVGEGEVRELAFFTIDRRDSAGTGEYWGNTDPATGGYWESLEPALVVLVASEDSERLNDFVAEETRQQLHTLDYDTRFAIAVFLGHFASDRGQEVKVEQVLRRGSQLALYARVPDHAQETKNEEISPYHVFSISKEGEWGQEITITLYLNEEAVVTETHFIR